MCGICGFTGKSNQPLLKKMTDVLYHRGPDEDGFYADEKVNLGSRRLSIIDLATGRQPIRNEDKSMWMVYNGEIYNFQELRKELEKQGHKFYTDHSDAEVIVHLYEEYGLEFAEKLNGMFAIALWDNKKEKLILVRDRMGVKPLFYSLINNKLVFASEIKAILLHPEYIRSVDHDAIYHYFTFKNIPAPLTAFKNISSVLPGEMLIYFDNNLSKIKWWQIAFVENEYCDELYAKGKIVSLLEDAVRLRMISDVPFGVYLSGGVDSSIITALMTKFTDKTLKTFSLGYEDELKNKEADLHYARKVSERFRTEHHEYIMSHRELIKDVENVIGSFDQPFSGTISTYFLSKLINKHVKVALSGDGADELFGSYLSHRTAQPIHFFQKLYDKVETDSLSESERNLFAPCGISFLKELYNKSEGDEVKWRYNLYLFLDKEKEKLLSNNFKSNLVNLSSYALLKGYFDCLTAKNPLNRILEMELKTQFPDQVLAFVDFLSMAHSVEVRSPFLDYRLVEFVSTIPGNMKIKNGRVKDILKQAVSSFIPEGVVERPKEGFVLPIFDWMTMRLKDYCIHVLSEKNLKKHDLLDIGVVIDLVQSYYSGKRENAAKIWNLMMFQIWWQRYFG